MGCRALVLLIWVLAVPSPGSGHVIFTPTTLRQWASDSKLIVVADILTPLSVWKATDGSDLQEYLSVGVVETIKGGPAPAEIDFFPHTEGEPRYRVGDRVLLFLQPTAERADFAKLAERFPYFTVQGAGNEWRVDTAGAPEVARAREWAALPPTAGVADVRGILLRQMRGGTDRLRRDALLELVRVRENPGFWPDAAAVAPFVEIARGTDIAFADRVALIVLLRDSPGFDAAGSLLTLARAEIPEREQIVLVRAAGPIDDPRSSAWLGALLEDESSRIRRQAALALGHAWHSSQVPRLSAAARLDERRVARAAVASLAAIGTAPARASLEAVAAQRTDDVARTARRLLDQRGGTTEERGG
jgi:hypothetical protein